jgi:hypothetical protein
MRVAAVKAGLPFDVAFSADDSFVLAWLIADGENQGGEFSFSTMAWRERK